MGLAEGAWVHEQATLRKADILYEDFIVCAKRLAKELREVHGCNLVIALTHLRNVKESLGKYQ